MNLIGAMPLSDNRILSPGRVAERNRSTGLFRSPMPLKPTPALRQGRVRSGSTTAMSRGSLNAQRSALACALISPKPTARENSRADSLRAGLASSAEVDERYVQKQLGHASAEMTRRYQRRRDRFRIDLTKAAGL